MDEMEYATRQQKCESFRRMNAHIILLLICPLLFCGCDRESEEERQDIASLQPYTNIQRGTIVVVQIRAEMTDYTKPSTRGEPHQYPISVGGEYVFEGISDGGRSVGLRTTNHPKPLYFMGRAIQSITPKKK